MQQGIRRPIQAYVLHGLSSAMLIFWSTRYSSEIGRWILWVGAIAGIISLIHMIVRRNYFEVIDNKLVVNDGIFRTTKIEFEKIEKFCIEPGPFAASKIILKDNTTIKYSDSQINDKKLKEFLSRYNILVE